MTFRQRRAFVQYHRRRHAQRVLLTAFACWIALISFAVWVGL